MAAAAASLPANTEQEYVQWRDAKPEHIVQRLDLHRPSRYEALQLYSLRLQSSNQLPQVIEATDPLASLSVLMYTNGSDRRLNAYLRGVPFIPDGQMQPVVVSSTDVLAAQGSTQERLINEVRRLTNEPHWRPTVGSMIRGLRRVLRNAPRTVLPIILYRGVHLGRTGNFATDIAHFTENGIMSTTADPVIALNFSGAACCFLVVKVPVGTPVLALGVSSLTAFSWEDEFMLPAHRSFTVEELFTDIPASVRAQTMVVWHQAQTRHHGLLDPPRPPGEYVLQPNAVAVLGTKRTFLLRFSRQPHAQPAIATTVGAMTRAAAVALGAIPWTETKEYDPDYVPEIEEEEEEEQEEEQEEEMMSLAEDAQVAKGVWPPLPSWGQVPTNPPHSMQYTGRAARRASRGSVAGY